MKKVYVISDGEYIKVGISQNIKKRISQLKTASPKELTLLYSLDGGRYIESKIHKDLSEYRAREGGEWFLHNKVTIDIIESYIEKDNVIKSEYINEICDLCKGNMEIKNGPYGKYFRCLSYPKCKFAKNIK